MGSAIIWIGKDGKIESEFDLEGGRRETRELTTKTTSEIEKGETSSETRGEATEREVRY